MPRHRLRKHAKIPLTPATGKQQPESACRMQAPSRCQASTWRCSTTAVRGHPDPQRGPTRYSYARFVPMPADSHGSTVLDLARESTPGPCTTSPLKCLCRSRDDLHQYEIPANGPLKATMSRRCRAQRQALTLGLEHTAGCILKQPDLSHLALYTDIENTRPITASGDEDDAGACPATPLSARATTSCQTPWTPPLIQPNLNDKLVHRRYSEGIPSRRRARSGGVTQLLTAQSKAPSRSPHGLPTSTPCVRNRAFCRSDILFRRAFSENSRPQSNTRRRSSLYRLE